MQSIILAESVIANTAKSTYQKKYKCPYCDKRFVRAKLHIHIQNEHEDLIPEGYTALRVAFNTINHKTEGHCIMCGAVTDWNEDKGRYERLCNNPKCHEAYKKMVAERTKKKYGTERLQTDPEYAEYVQRKALAGRKMHGEYKFADGGVIEYFGSYEKKFLQFMDQIMHCKSEDILAPAPSIKYMYNGEQHLYIPDFYYIPYNLIIEIKDGGSNPNNHPHRTGEDELKLRCKEEAIKQLNEFSYVRVVNNDFCQVLSIMAVLKYNMAHRYKDPVVKVNESTILESILINEDDIYYNKNKFDSGEINLCFITGLSGSGKSTMGRDMQSYGIEHYDMDDLQCIADHFTLNELKEYGDLIYSYFTGEGKKFYKTLKELKDEQIPESEYEDKLFPGFVHYAMKYAKAHKDKKFVLEGVWLFQKKWFTPDEFKDYAFYIKGTSMIISHIREAKRDSKDAGSKFKQGLAFVSCMTKNWKWYIIDEGQVNKFRKYFENLMTKNKFIESTSIGDDDQINDLIDICKRMATYEYICIDDKFNVLQNSRSNFDKHRTVSSSNFKKYNGGICYDYVNYMVGLLGKFKFKTFFNGYVEKDGQIDYTHTYILVYINDKVYWIEDSWKSHMGVFEFDSEDDAISYIVNIQSKGKEYFVVEYKPSSELVGISVIDFINIMNSKPEYNYKHNNSAKAFTIYSVKLDSRGNIMDEKYAKVSESGLLEDMSDTIAGALPLTPNPIPYESNKDNYYIIQHMENNAFAYSLTKDPVQYTMYSVDPEAKGFYKVFKSDKSKINKKYSTFKIRDRQKAKELYDELAKIESSNSKTFFAGDTSNDYIYQRLTEGSKIISDDQIRYDTRFEEVKNFNEEVQDICESVRNFILGDPITRLEEQVSTLSNLVNINESSNYVSSDYDMITSIEDYDNKVLKAKTAEQMGLIILYPEFKYGTCNKNTIDKLKKKYADFNALTKEKRTLSNRTAYHIFGYDNDTLYSKLLNLYVSTTMKSGGGSEGYSYNTMRSITPPIEQYYKPGEKVGTVSSDTKVARESFTDDSSWRQYVSKLCLEANNTSDTKKKNDLKNEIINLGWNPEIPFNEEAITRVKNMRHNLHIFTEVDAEEYIRNIHTFNEATYNQLKDKIVPVFICLFKGKSLHSRGIELYTGSEWSHAAMSFDSSMKQMYTFNMNPKVTSDGVSKGFTIESIEAYWRIDPSIKFKVHALFVTKEQKAMMEDAIKWYVIHQNETKYSFKTIINIALKRVSDFGSEYANKTEMVCSQFVYTILAIADFKTKVTKDASLVSPGDLDTSIDDRLYSMFIGGIGLYSSKKIDRMVRQIIPTLPLDKYNI